MFTMFIHELIQHIQAPMFALTTPAVLRAVSNKSNLTQV